MSSSLPPRDRVALSEPSSVRAEVSTLPLLSTKMSLARPRRRLLLLVLELVAVTYTRLLSKRKSTPICTVSVVA